MVSDNALVRIRELRYSYPGSDHDVLRIPFFDVTGRGLIAVTGPSGSGKSTLVELIAGTLRGEYRGSVEVLGQEWKNLHRDADRQRHLRRIGLIPQDYGLLTDRSVVDLLLQDLRDAGSGRTNEAGRVRAALREVGLEGFEHRQVAALSGGQRQRVAIARMLARDVELVIADEPTANLDPTLTEETVSLFRRLADHVPVLIITHDSQVAAACDRTVVLQSAVSDVSPQPVATAGRSRRKRGRVLAACLVIALIAGGIGAYVVGKGTRQNSAAASGGLRTASHPAARSRAKPTVPPTTTGASLASGTYVNTIDGLPGPPNYYMSVTSESTGLTGSVGFDYQDGSTSVVFTFTGTVEGDVATLTPISVPQSGSGADQDPSTVPSAISATIGQGSLTLGECPSYLHLVRSMSDCTFTLATS